LAGRRKNNAESSLNHPSLISPNPSARPAGGRREATLGFFASVTTQVRSGVRGDEECIESGEPDAQIAALPVKDLNQ